MVKYRKFTNSFFAKVVGFIFIFMVLSCCLAFLLLNGLKKYYGLGDDSEIALVGHSHLMLGVDKIRLEKELDKKISKYTREGVNVVDRQIMVEQLLNMNRRLKTVIYGVDAWSFTTEGLSNNSYKLFYPFMDNSIINEYVYQNANLSDYLTKKLIPTTRYDELLLSGSLRGYLGNWSNLKFGTVDVNALDIAIADDNIRKIENDENNIIAFKQTLAQLTENDVSVLLLYVPTIDKMTMAQPKKFNETIKLFEKFAAESTKVKFLNLQEPWSHNYSMFYDAIHMNPEGQTAVTESLITYLQKNSQ